jgi:acetyl-CoA C-acetyltransferase/3-oxo-5,6-didehydrosuberyl-CoA/3-oxoadipyl-CoA thiolase
LKGFDVDVLASLAMAEVVRRADFDPSAVEDVIFGVSNQVATAKNIARVALLRAGFPTSVPGTTLTRLCGSGLQAINFAAMAIETGQAEVIIAGGSESMTRTPYIVEKIPSPYARGDRMLIDAFTGTVTAPDGRHVPNGITAENLARQYSISREDQDHFAYQSHMNAKAAIEDGRLQEEIFPVEVPPEKKRESPVLFDTDEHVRFDTTLEKLATLRPVFEKDGTVTAGNSSGINDGAAAVLIMSADRAKAEGYEPLARIRGTGVAGIDPDVMGIGPIYSTPKALRAAGVEMGDIGLVELNEAFAAQVLACTRVLEIDMDRLNVNGGAIALGHPLGCTGARMMTTLLHEMKRRDVNLGLATLCIGGGQGISTVVERA